MEEYNVILLGKTGHGKSTLCNLLSNTVEFTVGHDQKSTTAEIKNLRFTNQKNNMILNIIDTPGFSDSEGRDQKNIENLIKYLDNKQNPRIHAIIIVISIQEPKVDNSIQEFLKEICKLFPLPEFWEHVIIFYSRYFGQCQDDLDELKERAEMFKDTFISLSEEIAQNLPIQKLTKDKELKYVLNNYNIQAKQRTIIDKNLELSKQNIDKIINWIKNMKIIYKELVRSYDQYTKLNSNQLGNSMIINYKQEKIKEYKDFDNVITKCNYFIKNVKVRIEPKIIDIPLQTKGKEKIFQKNITYEYFIDDKLMTKEQINEIIDKSDQKKDELFEKQSEEIKTENNVIGNRTIVKQFKEIIKTNKDGQCDKTKADEKTIEDYEIIEDKDWIYESKLTKNNLEFYNKYTKKINYLKKPSEQTNISVKVKEEKEEEKDLKKITINQYDIRNNNLEEKLNKKLIEEYKEQIITETNGNIDNNTHIGKKTTKIYKIIEKIYPNKDKKTENIEEFTEEYFIQGIPKTDIIVKEGKEYEIKYYEIFLKDSRTNNIPTQTNFKKIISEIQKNMLVKFEEKEFEKEGKLYKQNYKIFYTLDEKGQEIKKKEEPIEEESEKEIKTKEYFETEPEDSIIQKKGHQINIP